MYDHVSMYVYDVYVSLHTYEINEGYVLDTGLCLHDAIIVGA